MTLNPLRSTVLSFLCCTAVPAFALDKQGGPRDGAGSPSTAMGLSGSVMFGVSPYNPTYAARPDNTGIALLRYGGHVDFDRIGQYLSFPIDINFFSDRERPGLLKLTPSEFDIIAGVTTSLELGPGDASFGLRVEHDRAVDTGAFTQTYFDARGRYVLSTDGKCPKLANALRDGDVSGWATLGVFLFNPTYAARPDNTGLAFLRYGLHGEVSTFSDLLSFGVDGTFFTDRNTNLVATSELDLTLELIVHFKAFEVHLAYERDMPVDRSGSVQQFVYLLGAFSFDFSRPVTRAFTDTREIKAP